MSLTIERLKSEKKSLTAKLCELTKPWNEFDLVPKVQQEQCRAIGEALNALGGIEVMQDAYYEAKRKNRAASSIQPYWDGVGDWRW